MADEVTIGELGRSLAEFKDNVSERFNRIDRRLDALSYVRVDVYESEKRLVEARVAAAERRVAAIEDGQKWFRRMAISAVVVAVIGAVVPLLVAALTVNGG